MNDYIFICSTGTKVLLTDEEINEGDHVLVFVENKLVITKMTSSTNVNAVIGKVKKAFQLF